MSINIIVKNKKIIYEKVFKLEKTEITTSQMDMLHGPIWNKIIQYALPVPAILTTIGVCGVRILWICTVFPAHKTFRTIMTAYPLSLSITALLIFIAVMIYRPARRMQRKRG